MKKIIMIFSVLFSFIYADNSMPVMRLLHPELIHQGKAPGRG